MPRVDIITPSLWRHCRGDPAIVYLDGVKPPSPVSAADSDQIAAILPDREKTAVTAPTEDRYIYSYF